MSNLIRKQSFKLIALLLIFMTLIAIPLTSVYAESRTGDNVVVKSEETFEKTSFLTGNNIRVDGDINGTTFVAAGDVEVNGEIDGDLFVAAQSITINGKVKGSVFTASQNVTVNGVVTNNIYSAGSRLDIDAETDGSAFLAGQNISLAEKALIKKDVFIGGSQVYQNGTINGDLTSSSEDLSIDGIINGDLNYRSETEAQISNDADVLGETNWTQTERVDEDVNFTIPLWFSVTFSVLASILIWLVFKLVRPEFWNQFARKISDKPLGTFGFGLLAFFATPIIAFFLLFTVIGIPLSLIMITLYGISLYIAKITLSVFIGYVFMKQFGWSKGIGFLIFLISLIILTLLVGLPIFGWIMRFVIVTFALGAMILSIPGKKPTVHPTE